MNPEYVRQLLQDKWSGVSKNVKKQRRERQGNTLYTLQYESRSRQGSSQAEAGNLNAIEPPWEEVTLMI